MLNTSVAPWPSYSEEEQQAVARVLASNRVNYWTGEETRAFEREFAEWVGSARGVAVFNGTVALDLALKAIGLVRATRLSSPHELHGLGLMRGECRRNPVFATWIATAAKSITPVSRRLINRPPLGSPPGPSRRLAVRDDRIPHAADKHDLLVIEDCAQAHGARATGGWSARSARSAHVLLQTRS